MRDGQMTVIEVTPRLETDKSGKDIGRIGVELEDRINFEVTRPGPTPKAQFLEVGQMLGDTFYAIFHHKRTGVGISSFSGPVGIAGGWWYEIRNGGITRGLKFAVLINIALAVFNLLPIPVLDGGHIVFAIYESVFRRPLPARFVHVISTAFAVVLISFMLYITVFDFKRFFGFRFTSSEKPAQTNEYVPAAQP
jgi:regulator of sigma E protease